MSYGFPELLSFNWRGIMDDVIIGNILESMSDSLLVLGEDGQILYANKITNEILGYAPDDLREKGIAGLFFLKDQDDRFNQLFVDAVWKKSINNYAEVDYRHPDGSLRRLAATSSYLFAEGATETSFIGFVVLFKDITEIFNLRRKERELEQEKERIAREKFRSLHRLAMGVAHEIRNPMVTIGGFAARIVKDQEACPNSRQYAQNILEDARKLERVVDEIQAYCNLPEANIIAARIAPVIQEAIAEKVPRGLERDTQIRLHDSIPGDFVANFDPVLLKMAVLRLLDNAITFSKEGSIVDVYLSLNHEGTTLVIKDQGIGIDDQDLEFVFNPFFSTRVHGAGMGLAIVERIVHEHMGKIKIASKPGKGTEVRVSIPYGLDQNSPKSTESSR